MGGGQGGGGSMAEQPLPGRDGLLDLRTRLYRLGGRGPGEGWK